MERPPTPTIGSRPGTAALNGGAWVWVAGLLVVCALATPANAQTTVDDDVQITAKVEGPPTPPGPSVTKVIFKGLAYPTSNVTLQRNGQVVVVVPADPVAHFEIENSGLSAGTYTFTIFAEDTDGRIGRAMNFTVTVTPGTTTTLNGIFLGPTISIDKTIANLGDTLTFVGQTTPVSEVVITVDHPASSQGVRATQLKNYRTQSDAKGLWFYQLIADDLNAVGEYEAQAKASLTSGQVSDASFPVAFTVKAVATPPGPCDGQRPGDLNCDGKVNLTDFSILLFFWKKTNPSNSRADINKDNVVTIQDLSILLFWWTGNR